MQDVQDLMRKSLLFGMGAMSITRDKAEDLVNEIARRGRMSREEARGLVDEMVERGEKQRFELNRTIREQVRRTIDDMGLASREDVHELLHRVEALETHVAELRTKLEKK